VPLAHEPGPVPGLLEHPGERGPVRVDEQPLNAYSPVISEYRDGVQTLATLCPSVNLRPPAASLSQFGVFTFVAP
jgi:hypothetical protein